VGNLRQVAAIDGKTAMNERQNYREHLINARQKSFEDFDKTVLLLSGGGLGISITILKDIIGAVVVARGWLLTSWICWGLSLVVILLSYHLSRLAIDAAIRELDCGEESDKPGGTLSAITNGLNLSGAILFLVGLLTFIIFVVENLDTIHGKT
jgi:hypothetical protein